MRKVTLFIAASLDGYRSRADGSVDWLPVPSAEEDYGYADFLASVDTLVMGRKTYAQTLTFGPWPYAGRRTFVCSRTRTGRGEGDVAFVAEDAADFVGALRREPGGGIWLVGGAEIVRACLAARVVDEIVLSIPPVLLGAGRALFPAAETLTQLELRDCRTFADGLVQLAYRLPG